MDSSTAYDLTLLADPSRLARDSRRVGIAPDPSFTVSQWADAHRMLSTKSSAEAGHWRTSRTPYLREPMDCLSALSLIEMVVLMFAGQVGKTEVGLNFLGYIMHHVPGPTMLVQPTLDLAMRLSKQRLASMIEETPALRERVADRTKRDSGNTLLMKEFRGGILALTGANSAASLRQMPARFLFCDEVDAYPLDVDEEGDPIYLAEKRTVTFSKRKILKTSTPTEKGASRIEREYERTDKRRYYVPCPHCGHFQWLRWRGYNDDPDDSRKDHYRLVWLDEARERAGYICEECGVIIEEKYKTRMLELGEWRATAVGARHSRGYQLSALYTPLGWKGGWSDLLTEFAEASTNPTELKSFVNMRLAETWEENHSARIDADGLAKRAENYQMLTVPLGGLIITAGIDVQDNRIEVIQRAWGVGEESWLVNQTVVHGDPSRADLWDQVSDILDMVFRHESGVEMTTYCAAVDTGGHYTHEAYAWARSNKKKRRVIAIKGASTPGKIALGRPSRMDVNIRGQTIKKGVDLWPLGVDTIKSLIYGRIKQITEPGPGAYHWPLGLTKEGYWAQLTSERQVTRMVRGFAIRKYVKRDGDSNEALDCEVYAYAALQYALTKFNRATVWAQLARRLASSTRKREPLTSRTAMASAPPIAPGVTTPEKRSLLAGLRRNNAR